MKFIKSVILISFFIFSLPERTCAQCNSANSPSFQLSTSPTTVSVNGWCYPKCNIQPFTSPWPMFIATYYLPGGGQFSTTSTSNLFVPGIWTVQVTFYNNCSTSHTVLANLLPAPIVNVTSNNTFVCYGKTATLIASGAISYYWNTNETTSSISVKPTNTTTYSVTGTGTNGCTATDTMNIKVIPLPMLEAHSGQSPICIGQSVQLTVQGANFYTWDTGQTGTSIIVTPSVSTMYTVTGADQYGCKSNHLIYVVVLPCTGVSETMPDENEIQIYPTPVANNLNFAAKIPISFVEIQNLLGQTVKKYEFPDNVIPVSDIPAGIYNLLIKTIKNEQMVLKFIKE